MDTQSKIKIALISTFDDYAEYFNNHPELNKDNYCLVDGTDSLRKLKNDRIVFSDIQPLYDAAIKSVYRILYKLCLHNLAPHERTMRMLDTLGIQPKKIATILEVSQSQVYNKNKRFNNNQYSELDYEKIVYYYKETIKQYID